MKAIITILLISFSVLVLGQTIKTDSYWIAVESKPLDKYGISPLEGTILNFKENKVEFNKVFFDSIPTVKLKIKKNKVFIENKLWSRINYVDHDSLLLDFDKKMRVKFVPLETNEVTITEIQFWNNLDWIFYHDGYYEEIKLTNELWNMYPNEVAKNCVIFTNWEQNRYARDEKWNIKVVNDNHLFVKTFEQFDYEIYKVLSYSGDTVILKNLMDNKESIMVKIPSISDSDYNSIVKKIKNFKWKTTELINYSQAFEGDSALSKFNSGGIYTLDTTFIKMSSIKNNQVSFIFGDKDYKYFISDTVFNSGSWHLAPSGKSIILNKGCIQEDYIDLISVDEGTITIGKFDKLQIGTREGRFVDFYYVLKLEK